MTFADAIVRLVSREPLMRMEMREAITQLMSGQATPVQMAAFLVALRVKGETVDELAGAAEAMRSAAIQVRATAPLIVDTCGTGGDGQGTFNISTAAAFIVAGAGLVVAKHGNRSISSRCGSADLLERLGLPVESTPDIAETLLNEVGLAFLFAPSYHPAMKTVGPVRKELGIRTIFNLLGPLTNPAHPHVQLIGVYDAAWVKPVAQVLVALGNQDGVVVHSQKHDEIVLSGPTQVAQVKAGEVHIDEWWPEDFGVKQNPDQALDGGTPEENAGILMKVLSGESGPYRDAACMNAAALIRSAWGSAQGGKRALTLKEAFAIACDSIDSKAAIGKLEALKAAVPRRAA